jgi:hypothetical protein
MAWPSAGAESPTSGALPSIGSVTPSPRIWLECGPTADRWVEVLGEAPLPGGVRGGPAGASRECVDEILRPVVHVGDIGRTTENGPGTSVPEPDTVALLGLGLAALPALLSIRAGPGSGSRSSAAGKS